MPARIADINRPQALASPRKVITGDDCSSKSGVVARAVVFGALAGPALGLLAAVALLPTYAHLTDAKYQLDCLRAGIADAEALVETNQRLIRALIEDNVVPMRVARSQFGLLPELLPHDEVVAVKTKPNGQPADRPPLITFRRHRPPARPDGLLLRLAGKLQAPSKRRGLLLLAACAMLVSMLLFTEPARDDSSRSRPRA